MPRLLTTLTGLALALALGCADVGKYVLAREVVTAPAERGFIIAPNDVVSLQRTRRIFPHGEYIGRTAHRIEHARTLSDWLDDTRYG